MEDNLKAADLNGNGSVNSTDVRLPQSIRHIELVKTHCHANFLQIS
ncbi:MAG: hypothetical protein ACOYWZ_11500 [Bacillota bacterium]